MLKKQEGSTTKRKETQYILGQQAVYFEKQTKIVYGLFGQSNTHSTLVSAPGQLGKTRMYSINGIRKTQNEHLIFVF